MKKKALALSVLAAISSQAVAFQFDTGDDWNIRWDNTVKANVMSRVNKADEDVVNPAFSQPPTAAAISDDGDFSVNRKKGGIVSSRIDVVSELDVIWRQNWGFRVSGAGWYDAAYENNDNPKKGSLPGQPNSVYNSTWGQYSVEPGKYTDYAKRMHYAGGELLDAFVFGNWNMGETTMGVRAGRHTLYWGQSLLATGALTGIAGSMAALDIGKAQSVPGTEAKELFMPNNKVSAILQVTDNLTLNGFYAFEHVVNRYAAPGTFFSPAEVLDNKSQLAVFIRGTETSPRAGFINRPDKYNDSGEWGVNIQYFIEPWNLETSWIYISATDRNASGLYGTGFNPTKVSPEDAAKAAAADASAIGYYGWAYQSEIDVYGLSLSKQMFDISFGADLVYRKNASLNPEFTASLLGRPADNAPSDYSGDPDDYPGATGNVYTVVLNGLGLLNGDWGLWDGGSWILETTASMLEDYEKNEEFASVRVHKDRVVTTVAGVFRPTWYQVFPGWDMSLPAAVAYTIDGEQSPYSNGGNEEVGNASIGVEFDINQFWLASLKYNAFFGPQGNGLAAYYKDRDNISFTVKATF
jgi:hypothetical protein